MSSAKGLAAAQTLPFEQGPRMCSKEDSSPDNEASGPGVCGSDPHKPSLASKSASADTSSSLSEIQPGNARLDCTASTSSRDSAITDPSRDTNTEHGFAAGWNGVRSIAMRLMGWNWRHEEEEEEEREEPEEESENSYQLLQKMLTDLQDQSWLISQEQLTVCLNPDGSDQRLGRGSFGTVYKGVMNKSVPVAIKAINHPTLQNKMNFVKEMATLMNLRHQNVCCWRMLL
ncbi:hypothetical protein WJX84_006255 [Apatococcus fuscideae]|uniref:Protein kinase domain-containing protein n=1 Tax=Apatococcus fuscideae TaxID=2026836 RepID=A0AAW1T212_9CHLO